MTTPFRGDGKGSRPADPAADGGDPVRFAIISQVRAYWEALRQDGALPMRSQIDPRGIEAALTSAFMVEQVAPGVVRFRIAGRIFTELAGMDVRGMPLSALFTPSAREVLMQAVAQVFALPARLDLTLEAERGLGRPALEARLLMLPLRDDQGHCRLALGCLAVSGAAGRSPRRFEITRRAVSPVLSGSGKTAPQPAYGFAENLVPFIPPRAVPGRPHLRLVKTDS